MVIQRPGPPDPRVAVADKKVLGTVCLRCALPAVGSTLRCIDCGGELTNAAFGPRGTVWSSTTVRIPVGSIAAPYTLAFVDMHEGPRVLVHVASTEPLRPGTAVEVIGQTASGDVLVGESSGRQSGSQANSVGRRPSEPSLPRSAAVEGTYVRGVGTSNFGRFPERRLEDLAWEAISEALKDAAVDPDQIEAVWIGSVYGPVAAGPRIMRGAGISGIPVMRVENACASGTTAYHEAVHAVGSGRYRNVLALGYEQLSARFDGPILPDATDLQGAAGMAMPAIYALQASRYLYDNPTATVADLAAVAVKNKANGVLNPRAQLRQAPSIEEVLESRAIADPLTLLQCCPMSDGAAAAVIGREGDVAVRSSVLGSGAPWDQRNADLWSQRFIERMARASFGMAGLSPRDIDVLEIHDAFTIGEIVTLEALGFAEPGEAASFATSGRSGRSGTWPVNPSGGLLSRGHPLGATGLAQVAEIVWQLRGRAEERQVSGARYGLVETMGGGASQVDGNAAVVTIMEAAGR